MLVHQYSRQTDNATTQKADEGILQFLLGDVAALETQPVFDSLVSLGMCPGGGEAFFQFKPRV